MFFVLFDAKNEEVKKNSREFIDNIVAKRYNEKMEKMFVFPSDFVRR